MYPPGELLDRDRLWETLLAGVRLLPANGQLVPAGVHEAGLLAERAPVRLDATLHADARSKAGLSQAVLRVDTLSLRYGVCKALTDRCQQNAHTY